MVAAEYLGYWEVTRGACVNIIGFGLWRRLQSVLARPLASAFLIGSGGESRAEVVSTRPRWCMEAFLVSTMVVGLAEIRDKVPIS